LISYAQLKAVLCSAAIFIVLDEVAVYWRIAYLMMTPSDFNELSKLKKEKMRIFVTLS
jgi:hypothetical protein